MSEHINLSINGLLRDIDTMLNSSKPVDQKLFRSKMEALHKCITDHMDQDIPNNVFLGVSNRTRQMCMLGGAFVASLSNAIMEDILNTIRQDLPKDPDAN